MNIRNFAIIAHIDHGKSTLADRIMEICGAVGKDHRQQLLDSLELEREHGITIKLKAIRLNYTFNSQLYTFNLLDTPGHVDFSYEVSRSLASVEGAVLVVDATQGVQAQTLANFHLALESNLILIPVINKIDSPQAKIKETEKELTGLGFKGNEIVKVSAKTGEGVENLINAIIARIPSPSDLTSQLSALIFDSALDPYKGVVATVRLFGGKLKAGDEILLIAGGTKSTVLQIGYLTPAPKYVQNLESGEVGFVVTSLKDLSSVKVGDTIVHPNEPVVSLPGYRQAKPVIFLSFFPTDTKDFSKLKEALERLRLNDSSLSWASESSLSLGQGLRVGFLGLLHAQITQERLEREYGLDIIVTSPSVNFEIDGRVINKPSDFDPTAKSVREPYALVTIFAPQKYYGAISQLIYEKRGEQTNLENVGASQKIEAKIPLLEILIGFYDQLKTVTSGYASFDFEVSEYRDANLVKLDILVNRDPVEGLAQIVSRKRAEGIGRRLVEKLKEVIPRQNIPIPIQAAIGGKIIARETVPAFRKDVTQKLYGGDVTRKTKLLEKQKKGKKRMKRFGQVEIPQEAFLAVLKI
ncbi:elongation factor 4 [Candidatus Curtissbacteria bacterium RIFCSPHIGHO2_02_FULL_40_17]|uniref:Elongation factor 4 n=2 Tax=Candidatus Curtissiibacteriota TaxID=1752717 RepID=A0A1F5GJW6_9BACT|nr:MAG: elongation factor 4 [Candidatus Curtissbacteria bacterium RIFCSPHIGHO2_02_FULL_40_17]OGE03419.1 MAG: elongation factor 4 [Candidatus Curtissbacteria bacterium RIFCSPHIGHO2_12_FULL_41_17]